MAHAGLIESEADIRAGVRALRRKCEIMRHVHALAGDPPLRRRPAGFEGLARIVVGQQLSVASAEAIWRRTCEAVAPFEPEILLASEEAVLRAAGLSRPKVRTLRSVAEASSDGRIVWAELGGAPPEHVHEVLTAVPGIGPWTADIFLMFCVGHRDAFAPGDLALQAAAQIAGGLETRPKPDELAALAERWRPWRGVAARMLWAFYKVEKEARSGLPV